MIACICNGCLSDSQSARFPTICNEQRHGSSLPSTRGSESDCDDGCDSRHAGRHSWCRDSADSILSDRENTCSPHPNPVSSVKVHIPGTSGRPTSNTESYDAWFPWELKVDSCWTCTCCRGTVLLGATTAQNCDSISGQTQPSPQPERCYLLLLPSHDGRQAGEAMM